MSRIREILIENFRGIASLSWQPQPGINGLIGPGDSSKSTILDAIDWCIGARRSLSVTDADFHGLQIDRPIRILVTIGALQESLKSLESYGLFLRGFDAATCAVEDEPGDGLEDVLSVELTISDDLEPHWTLVSDRASAQGLSRNLAWADRQRLAPLRIGSFAARHMSWQRGSLLHTLSEEELNVAAALATASRSARDSFGDQASASLEETLETVRAAAERLGIGGGRNPRAMLDPQTVSLSGGAITLHDDAGIPLNKLGLGSSRLLVAGLQGSAESASGIVLVDELEHGLEPHRIARFLVALGAKETDVQRQVFLTTHSPVVLRELQARQLHVVRRGSSHQVLWAGSQTGLQGPLRSSAEGFLGTRVLICEGATEVGLVRGVDLYRDDERLPTANAAGLVMVDAGGVSRVYALAKAFQALGYEIAVLRDDDEHPKAEDEEEFLRAGGTLFKWSEDFALEEELFFCLSDDVCVELCRLAISIHGRKKIEDQIKSASGQNIPLDRWLESFGDIDDCHVHTSQAAKSGDWFKRIDLMENAARSLIAPNLDDAHEDLSSVIDGIFRWAGVDVQRS